MFRNTQNTKVAILASAILASFALQAHEAQAAKVEMPALHLGQESHQPCRGV